MTKRLTIFYQNTRMIYLLTAKIQTPVCLLSAEFNLQMQQNSD